MLKNIFYKLFNENETVKALQPRTSLSGKLPLAGVTYIFIVGVELLLNIYKPTCPESEITTCKSPTCVLIGSNVESNPVKVK